MLSSLLCIKRYVNITIVDIYGSEAPTVTVTLRFVGSNDHSPVVNIASQICSQLVICELQHKVWSVLLDNETDLLEGVEAVPVTNGSLTVSDLDNDL